MKGEKIPEGVIKFMEKTPGGKIIDAHAEILPRTSSAETQPISRPNPKQIGIKKEVQKKRTENIDTGKTQPISVKNLREKTNKLSPEEQKKKDALEEALPGLLELTEENKLEKIFPSLFKRIQKIISEEKGELNSQERKYKKSKIRKDRESVIWVQQKKGLLEANPIKYFEEKVRESEEDFNYLSSEDYSGSEEEREKKKDETTRMIVQFKDVIEALEKKLKPKSTDNPSANLPPLEAENVGPVEQTPTPDIATPEIHTEPVEPTPDTQTAEKEAKLKRIEALKQKERELEETLRLLTEQVEALPDNEIEEIKSEEALELERGIAELQTSIEKKRKEKEGTWGIRKFKHNRLEGEIKTLQEKLAMKNEILSGYLLREKEKAQRKLVGRNSKK
mgnify:FL=1